MNSIPNTTRIDTTHDALMGPLAALRAHWPEYLIEGWALGMFMISAAMFGVLLEHPQSAAHVLLSDDAIRRVLGGIAMGLTAIALIYSPWGKRSGAHMNPAITLAFLRAGHIARWDAAFYIAAQFVGGTLGVYIALAVLGEAFASPPVSFVTTVPGSSGLVVAFVAEFVISFLMMTLVLRASNSARVMRLTGVFAGALVATFIAVEAPYSGMSMNPARSFASAFPAQVWTGFWIYLVSPIAAMQLALSIDNALRGLAAVKCAKLIHADDQRCIHCGYVPARN
jgi:aquaporin Z